MLTFQFPTVEDRAWIQPLLSATGNMSSENAFGTLFIWTDTYHNRVCRLGDAVLLNSGRHHLSYNFPLGSGDLRSLLEQMMQDAQHRSIPFAMWGMTAEETARIEQAMPGRFTFTLDVDGSDYIYNAQDLCELPGKKYQKKRNHLSKFRRSFEYTYADITPDNIGDCLAITKAWDEENDPEHIDPPSGETLAIRRALTHFEALELRGGLLYIADKPVAFTLGEEINKDVFVLHFEKALGGYDGLYAAINYEFASRRLTGYRYINREEDMGIEGLRKAKQSYHPAFLAEKYRAVPKEATL